VKKGIVCYVNIIIPIINIGMVCCANNIILIINRLIG
jgi:hypothetical protein